MQQAADSGPQCVVEVESDRAASRLERRGDFRRLERVDLTQRDELSAEAPSSAVSARGPRLRCLNPLRRVIELANVQRDPGPGHAQPRIL